VTVIMWDYGDTFPSYRHILPQETVVIRYYITQANNYFLPASVSP